MDKKGRVLKTFEYSADSVLEAVAWAFKTAHYFEFTAFGFALDFNRFKYLLN